MFIRMRPGTRDAHKAMGQEMLGFVVAIAIEQGCNDIVDDLFS